MGIKGVHYKLLLMVGLPYMFTAMDLLLISLALPSLIGEWGLSGWEAGFLAGSVFIGMFIGAPLWGVVSDRIGRKNALLSTVALYSLATALSAYAWDYFSLLAFRILIGVGIGGCIPVSFVYLSEFLPTGVRGTVLVLLDSFWAYGWIAASLLGYLLIPSYGWRAYFLSGAFPIILVPLFWALLPQSPRYLAEKGFTERARRIAERFFTDMGEAVEGVRVGLRDLWSRRYLRVTALTWIMWFTMVYGYYSFFLWIIKSMVKMGYPLPTALWYNLLTSLAQIPGYFSAAILVDRLGRKPTLTLFLVLTAASVVGFAVSRGPVEMAFWLAAISFFNLGAWGIVMTYSAEVYPTPIRGSGYGAASGFGRLAGIVGPTVTGFVIYRYGVFGALILVALVFLVEALDVAVLGVETMGRRLE